MSPLPPPIPAESIYTSCYCEENIYLLAQSFLAENATTSARGEAWPWEIYVVFVSNGGKTVALWSQKAREDVVVWDYHVVLVLRPLGSGPRAGTLHVPHGTDRDRGASPCAQPRPSPQLPHKEGQPAISQGESGRPGGHAQAWVYDFDTTLAVPCPWREYVAGTFPYVYDEKLAACIDARYLSLFRVIPAGVYLDHFASDRSHMIVPGVVETRALDDLGGEGSSGTVGAGGPSYSMPPPPYPPLCGAKAKELGVVNNLMRSFVAMDVEPVSLAEEDEHLGPHPPTLTPTSEAAAGAPLETEVAGAAAAGVGYGQVMDVKSFVRWLSEGVGQ